MSECLKIDLYELTMAAAYLRAGRNPRATFELFVRRMPPHRGYLLVAGLAQAVEHLESYCFQPEDIDYLRGLDVFAGCNGTFLDALAGMRFTGEVWAMPEGTVAFAGEPLVRVSAPLVEAQLAETYLLATINFQTMVATKASRVVGTAAGRPVVDFGSRRAHGPEAGVLAARASYIGGCSATSNLEAGRRYGIPVSGTMAHSFVMAFSDEETAFGRYLDCFGAGATLLVDTYDSLRGAKRAAAMGPGVRAVRLDSGDLAGLSRRLRSLLDAVGRKDIRIFASGDLNEYRIEALLAKQARLDAFGVGTDMVTSQDAPTLDGVYKVVEVVEADGQHTYPVKLSTRKTTWPGAKQVYRRFGKRGQMLSDTVAWAEEPAPEGQPLLAQVMKAGKRLGDPPSLGQVRERAVEQLATLPPRLKRLHKPALPPVRRSDALLKLWEKVRRGPDLPPLSGDDP